MDLIGEVYSVIAGVGSMRNILLFGKVEMLIDVASIDGNPFTVVSRKTTYEISRHETNVASFFILLR
jgi:hypothetical protein